MFITDTHCHLYLSEFDEDRSAVIERAETEGVNKFYLPAIDSHVTSRMLEMEEKFPGKCFAMMGLHPCSVGNNYEEELRHVETWLSKRKFAAIGEIGLDFYWDKSFREQQLIAFRRQVNLAIDYHLPVVLHSRESIQECIDVIAETRGDSLKGIFHCFGSKIEHAKQIMDLGFYFGIGGVITYKNSGLASVVKDIPLQNIVIETDAPYLSPIPFRGKRNESSYLKYIVEKIASIKNVSVEEVAEITSSNAQKIFVH